MKAQMVLGVLGLFISMSATAGGPDTNSVIACYTDSRVGGNDQRAIGALCSNVKSQGDTNAVIACYTDSRVGGNDQLAIGTLCR